MYQICAIITVAKTKIKQTNETINYEIAEASMNETFEGDPEKITKKKS